MQSALKHMLASVDISYSFNDGKIFFRAREVDALIWICFLLSKVRSTDSYFTVIHVESVR